MSASKFKYFSLNDPEDELNLNFISDVETPIIEEAEKMSKYVHFIIKGQVHIMDKNCLSTFGILETGSYFGDISVFLNQPNKFSFCYDVDDEIDELLDKSLYLLSVPIKDFIDICDRNPVSRDVMLVKARKR